MFAAVLQSLIAPRYIRRYVGRHRPRLDASAFGIGVDAEVSLAPPPRLADKDEATG